MSFFEFILIITSVIYALCMAPLLSGVVRILQYDGEVRFFLPQTFVALYLFLLVVVLWWTMWWFRDVQWQFATYLFMILEPVVMYLGCAMIFPNRLNGDRVDIEEHYYKIRIPLLITLLLIGTLAFTDGLVMGIEPLWHNRRYIQLVFLGLVIWALIDERRQVQLIFSAGSLVAMISLITVWFWVPAT